MGTAKKFFARISLPRSPPSLCPSNPAGSTLWQPHILPTCVDYLSQCTLVPSFLTSHTHLSFLPPPTFLPCLLVSWSLQSSLPSQPTTVLARSPCPLAPLKASPDQSFTRIHHANFLLPLLMSSFCLIYISSRSKHLCACSLLLGLRPSSLICNWKKLHHHRPGHGHHARAMQAHSAHTSVGDVSTWELSLHRAESRLGCSALEAGRCWWIGGKNLGKSEQLETEESVGNMGGALSP